MHDKPRLLYQMAVSKRRYFRRCVWASLALIAVTTIFFGFNNIEAFDLTPEQRARLDPRLIDAGAIVSGVLLGLLLIHMLVNLGRGLLIPNEAARFFDRGFMWKRGRIEAKYGWGAVKTYREGVRQIRLLGRPLLKYGAHTLTMRDGRRFRISPRHGDMARFARAVRPIIADVTGTRISHSLREGRAVRLHPQLAIAPPGMIVGKQSIRWQDLDFSVKRGRLIVRRRSPKGGFRTVKTFRTYQIDNLAGLTDVAVSTIQNHQPERFNIRTQQGVLISG